MALPTCRRLGICDDWVAQYMQMYMALLYSMYETHRPERACMHDVSVVRWVVDECNVTATGGHFMRHDWNIWRVRIQILFF